MSIAKKIAVALAFISVGSIAVAQQCKQGKMCMRKTGKQDGVLIANGDCKKDLKPFDRWCWRNLA
jgi:hypothetical protein